MLIQHENVSVNKTCCVKDLKLVVTNMLPENRRQLLAREMTRDSQQCLNKSYVDNFCCKGQDILFPTLKNLIFSRLSALHQVRLGSRLEYFCSFFHRIIAEPPFILLSKQKQQHIWILGELRALEPIFFKWIRRLKTRFKFLLSENSKHDIWRLIGSLLVSLSFSKSLAC